MTTDREVALACRCQLLTGSYEDAPRSCGCASPALCKLTFQQLKELRTHPKVVAAKERNLEEFEASNE